VRISLRQRIIWCTTALAVAFGLLSAWGILLYMRGYNFLTLFSVHNPNTRISLLERWQTNMGNAIVWLADYYTLLIVLVIVGSILYLVLRRKFYLPFVTIAPFFVILFNTRQTPRYWIGSVNIALLATVVVLAWAMGRYPRMMRIVLLAAAGIWIALIWFPFVGSAYHHPIDLPLPEREYDEYLVADASGFGLAEIVEVLRPLQPDAVIGLLSNCWGLQYTAPDLPIECPRVNPSGADVEALTRLVESRQGSGVYVVLEHSPYVPQTIPGQMILSVERPKQRANLTLYHLIP
jgi:hypothetical protein